MVNLKDVHHEVEEDTWDTFQQNPPPTDKDCTGAPPKSFGGGNGKSNHDKMKNEDVEMDSMELGDVEDTMEGQEGKKCTPKTTKGMEMDFCCLSKSNNNTIVVYFGMSTMDKLADFWEKHWTDTFI